jgi:hypothetical protein
MQREEGQLSTFPFAHLNAETRITAAADPLLAERAMLLTALRIIAKAGEQEREDDGLTRLIQRLLLFRNAKSPKNPRAHPTPLPHSAGKATPSLSSELLSLGAAVPLCDARSAFEGYNEGGRGGEGTMGC